MSADVDDALTLTNARQAEQPRASHPKGWEPHVIEHGHTAEAVSQPMEGDPSERDLIVAWGMDPDEWAIVGDVQVRRWQTYDERWLRYFKASLCRRTPRAAGADVAELVKLATSRKFTAPRGRTDDGWASVACLSDWQIGKGEGGGTAATVAGLRARLAALDDLWKRTKPPQIVLNGLGDMTEAVTGHYAAQAFTVDLDQREQDRVARSLLYSFVETAARRAPKVTVTGVACNHGESRNGSGRMHTRPSDNRTLTYVENVAEVCAQNPDAFGHVEFVVARDTILALDIAGIPTTNTHGHLFESGAPMAAAQKWWAGQIVGLQAAAAGLVLFTAHRHHFQVSEESGRTVVMAPACDGGSQWFTDRTGKSSPRGLLSLSLGAGIGNPLEGERCWDDLRVL